MGLIIFRYDMTLWIQAIQTALVDDLHMVFQLPVNELPDDKREEYYFLRDWLEAVIERERICAEMNADALEILS